MTVTTFLSLQRKTIVKEENIERFLKSPNLWLVLILLSDKTLILTPACKIACQLLNYRNITSYRSMIFKQMLTYFQREDRIRN